MNVNSITPADVCKHLACALIKLASHDLRRSLQNNHLFAAFFQLPGGFQTQNASADYNHILYSVQHCLDLFDIAHTADGNNLRLVRSRNRRHKAFGPQSVNKLCIFQCCSVRKCYLFFICMNTCYFFFKEKVDIVLLIPGFRLNQDFFCIQLRYHGFCQHRTVVRRISLI